MGIYKETIRKYMVGHQMRQVVSNTGILDLAQFYLDATAVGATQDKTLFEAELNALPTLAKNEAETILVPGIYKNGKVYGFNGATKGLVEFDSSRASSGTYFDKNGIMQTAAPGIPRIDHDPITKACKGYLLEDTSVNLVPWSNDFTQWVGGVTVTPGAGSTSYGKSFSRVAKSRADASESIIHSPVQSVANQTYAFTLTLRSSSKNRCSLGIGVSEDSEGGIWGSSTNSSVRIVRGPGLITRISGSFCDVTGLSASEDTVIEITRRYVNSNIQLRALIYPGGHDSTTIGDSVLVSCAQLEPMLSSTSYIETSGTSNVRAADTLVSVADIVPFNEASVVMDYIEYISAGNNSTFLSKGSDSSRRFLYNSAGANIMFDGLNYATVARRSGRIISSYTETKMKIFNGGISGESPHSGALKSYGLLRFNSIQAIKTLVKSLTIFSRQLTDQEHIDITV